jgi:hypothetical protein
MGKRDRCNRHGGIGECERGKRERCWIDLIWRRKGTGGLIRGGLGRHYMESMVN